MRRFRHPTSHYGIYVPPVPPPPDEEEPAAGVTWPYSSTLTTMVLPGTPAESYFLLIDVTSRLPPSALADVNSLRFTTMAGTKLGHLRTATDRILVGGTFQGGVALQLVYYWGAVGQTQPGVDFPSATDLMSKFSTFLIFEDGEPVDYAADPATFTATGSVTYGDGYLGQSMTPGAGNYISTTAAKLTTGGRTKRHAFCLTEIPEAGNEARCVIWGDWTQNKRSFQLYLKGSGSELYTDSDGTAPYTAWTARQPTQAGRNFIGCSWTASEAIARVQLNDYVYEGVKDSLTAPVTGLLYDASPLPFQIGGTSVATFGHPGSVEAYFELHDALTAAQMEAFFWAWRESDMLFNVDRTPNSFDALGITGVSTSTEVQFPQIKITFMSPDTPISVAGDGSPQYSIGSADGVLADVRPKSSTPGHISDGQYLTFYHTASHLNSTATTSTVTIGTVTSNRTSTTIAASGGGQTTTPSEPEGDADVYVDSVPALLAAIAAAPGGTIIEMEAGDYRSYGWFEIKNKDNTGNDPIVVRASTRPWDGFLGNGLPVSDETHWVPGSGGVQLAKGVFRNLHNIIFDGFRGYVEGFDWVDDPSNPGEYIKQDVKNRYIWECWGLRNCTFRYCYLSGNKPETPESEWYAQDGGNDWEFVPRGWGFGHGAAWENRCIGIRIEHCLIRFCGFSLFVPKMYQSIVENCMIMNASADSIRNEGDNEGTIFRYNVIGRMFPQGPPGDVAHPDQMQCTVKGQPALRSNLIYGNIWSVGDCPHGKAQGVFVEDDGTAGGPVLNTIENNLFFHTSTNTIYLRPADRNTVKNNTIIADFFTGQAPDASCNIDVNPWGLSFGNNVVTRNVYEVISAKSTDTVTQNIRLARADYGVHLVNYSQGGTACRLYDPYKCTLSLPGLARLAPRSTSALHPSKSGYDVGCIELFRHYGVLP